MKITVLYKLTIIVLIMKKKLIKIYLITAITLIAILSCNKKESEETDNLVNKQGSLFNQDTTEVTDTCISDTCYICYLSETADNLYNELINAFNDSCFSCLETFLDNWNNKIEPENQSLLLNDTIINIYKIYRQFY